jgi:hypothetical protein
MYSCYTTMFSSIHIAVSPPSPVLIYDYNDFREKRNENHATPRLRTLCVPNKDTSQ